MKILVEVFIPKQVVVGFNFRIIYSDVVLHNFYLPKYISELPDITPKLYKPTNLTRVAFLSDSISRSKTLEENIQLDFVEKDLKILKLNFDLLIST